MLSLHTLPGAPELVEGYDPVPSGGQPGLPDESAGNRKKPTKNNRFSAKSGALSA